MAIYCNTLEGNMQYSDDPYCFTPNRLIQNLLQLVASMQETYLNFATEINTT